MARFLTRARFALQQTATELFVALRLRAAPGENYKKKGKGLNNNSQNHLEQEALEERRKKSNTLI